MVTIGLTGGIGAGKSTVAGLLAERGAVVIDADAIAREIVEPGGAALAELVTEFGPRILRADGHLDRAELAGLAFGDPEATRRLNAIMHPLIGAEARRRIAASRAGVVVYDMPLLVETGQAELVDRVVVVDVPEDVQVERAVGLRGLEEGDVRRRMEVQASRADRLAVADAVIDNSGSPQATAEQVDRLWEAWGLSDEAPTVDS
jgi:dephospho-CoA kinase